MQPNLIQIQFSNETDKKISASLFKLFSDNSGLKVTPTFSNCNYEGYFNNLKNWLMKNKFDCELIRMQFITNHKDQKINRIYFRPFMFHSGTPFGSSCTESLFIVGECFSPKQYQSGIIDVPVDCEFDGYTTDVLFDVEPKETFVLTLFERITEEKKKAYEEKVKQFGGFERSGENKIEIDKGLTPFKGFPIVVENDSDEDLTIDLFNPDHYRKLAEYDKNGKVYTVYHNGRENFGIKNVHIDNDTKEYGYICDIEHLKIKKENRELRDIDDLVKRVNHFNCIRIVNPNESKLNDIIINGKTIRTEGYVGGEYCHISVDVRLDSFYDYDSCIVTVPPKTNMMFSFGKTEEIIDCKPKRMVSGFVK